MGLPRLKLLDVKDTAVACCAPIAATALTDDEAEATARLFKALADPTRIRILNLLLSSDDPVCACDLFPAAGLSQPTVSFHLKKLLEAGLITREERGTWAYYSVDDRAMARLGHVADVRKGTRRPM
jgi:ArsR family transcriptional regulator, arsenate/arsenite/antimonite-responsive transcriptional repressor